MNQIIYILTNEAMPDYIKIGITTDQPLEMRVKQLDVTSTPLPFEVYYAAEVPDARKVERSIHDAFDDFRVRSNREFFTVSPERVVPIIKLVETKNVTPNQDFVETEEDQKVLDKARERRSRFSFKMAEIPVGSTLTFTRDKNIICTVADNTKVNFENKIMSLNEATITVMNRLGYNWKAFQGPRYWEFENEILDDRRKRLEELE